MMIHPVQDGAFIAERLNGNEYHAHKVKRVLCKHQSSRQLIEIVELENYGKSLVLDGQIQSTERDEHIYHESLIYPAYCLAENAKKVLCIGGANGGVLREVVKFPVVKRIDVVDLDEEAARLSRQYLPHMHEQSYDLPSVNFDYADPREWIGRHSGTDYDIVYADLQDIEGCPLTEGLFSSDFYQEIAGMLPERGIFVTHAGYFNPISNAGGETVIRCLQRLFSHVVPYVAYVPSLGCLWMFVMAASEMVMRSSPEIGARLALLKGGGVRFFDAHHYRLMCQMATLELNINPVTQQSSDIACAAQVRDHVIQFDT